jgi:hypothetical protein
MTRRNHRYGHNTSTHDSSEAFGIVVHKTQADVSRLTAADPLDALVMAIGYLREGYHVLLTDATVEALRDDRAGAALERLAQQYRSARV